LYGVTVYEEVERQFSVGDRVQFTAPERFTVDGKILTIANRARGTIGNIGRGGQVHLLMDSGKKVVLDGRRKKHLDHGYAVTSHSSQGLTEDRTIVDIDTDHAGELLVNRRTAYVGGSRSRAYLAFYTNDAERLTRLLDRDVSKQAALTREEVRLLARQHTPAVQAHGQSHAI
jgi:ATP-dependent exoDNAse (exonuclease V) alpha subunit